MRRARLMFAAFAGVVVCGCEKRAPTPTGTPATASASSSAMPVPRAPIDPSALRAACEELVRVHDAAEDQYLGLTSPHDVSREALTCISQSALPGSVTRSTRFAIVRAPKETLRVARSLRGERR